MTPPVKARQGAVSDAVATVLALAGRPMRAREVHRSCEELLGRPVRWGTVKNALLSSSAAQRGVIQKVAYGMYVHVDLANAGDATALPAIGSDDVVAD